MSLIPEIFLSAPTAHEVAQLPPAEREVRQEQIKAYVAAHWCRKTWRPVIESQVEATVQWSRAISAQFAAGEDREQAGAL